MSESNSLFAVYSTADPSDAVVRAVTERSEVDPTELPPLYDAVDPDALDRLVADRQSIRLTFMYAGYEISVSAPDRITITEPDDPGGLIPGAATHYLTDEYRDKLEALAVDSGTKHLSFEDFTQSFLEQCRTFEELFKNDTPITAIRRIAFHQTKHELHHDR